MKRVAAALTLMVGLLAPATAFAYVGPGAGLSLLGALWALVMALGLALMFIVAWPVRSLLRKRRARQPQRGEGSAHAAGMTGGPSNPR